jgi:hypothetical protein
MARRPERPLTLQEIVELQDLRLAEQGLTHDDVTRSIRARLKESRAGNKVSKKRARPAVVSLESRVTALEREVKRLRKLIGKEPKNG